MPNAADNTPRDLGPDVDASHLIKHVGERKPAKFISELTIKPQEQPRLLLGVFGADNPPVGFAVSLTPDPNPPGSVVTHVTSIGNKKKYRLILHVANYSNKPVTARVEQL